MSTPELLFETDAPLTGHTTTWHLEFEGRPIDVKLERGDQPVSIIALDTGRTFKTTSQRGAAIVALVLEAYAAQFGDDMDTEEDRTEEAAPADMEPAEHTAEDSLIYLNNAARILLDLAEDDIHGVYHVEHAVETEDLPEHLAAAVSAMRAAARLITAETALHGLHRRRFYSNGTPTTGTYQEAGAEPQGDGTRRIVMHDVTFDRYPDGQPDHPLFRDVIKGTA